MHSAMVGVQIEQANQTKNPYEMGAMPRSNDLDSAREKAMMESLMMAERNHCKRTCSSCVMAIYLTD
jgi:hypothetical protein